MSSTKIFTSHWNYVLDVVILPKFGNSSISVRLIKTSILEKPIFYVFSWFNFNNLGLALGNALRFYISEAKRSKLEVKVLGASSYDSRIYRGKNGRWFFSPSPLRFTYLIALITSQSSVYFFNTSLFSSLKAKTKYLFP